MEIRFSDRDGNLRVYAVNSGGERFELKNISSGSLTIKHEGVGAWSFSLSGFIIEGNDIRA